MGACQGRTVGTTASAARPGAVGAGGGAGARRPVGRGGPRLAPVLTLVAALLLLPAAALLFLPAVSSGHAIPVHQQIARDAGLVWVAAPLEVALHLEGSGPVDPVGAVRYAPGDDIVTGSGDEDQEFNYLLRCTVLSFLLTGSGSCAFGPPFTRGFFEHFWDPDQPDAGGPAAYDQGFQDPTVNGGERLASSYAKAQAIWDTRVICRYTGRNRDGTTCPVDRDEAYYWLGRVAHLLEDLAVPAHVHGVRHDPAAALFGGVDPFETFVWHQYESGAGSAYQALAALGGAYAYEALPGLDEQAAFMWADVHPDATDLFKLFWYTAQKTQYYATGGTTLARAGDAGAYRRWGDATSVRFEPSLWSGEGIEPVGAPHDVVAALPEMASALVPHALRAVAGLYRLFWHDTHAIGLSLSGRRLGLGDTLAVTLVNRTGAENTGDLYLAVQGLDGAVWVFDGLTWGATVVAARPGATLTAEALTVFSTTLDAPIPEGTYTFYSVLVAAGRDPADMGNWLSNLAAASFTFAAPSSSARR